MSQLLLENSLVFKNQKEKVRRKVLLHLNWKLLHIVHYRFHFGIGKIQVAYRFIHNLMLSRF